MFKIYTVDYPAGLTISPAPTSYDVDTEDIDNEQSKRSVSGILHRTRIRKRNRQLSLAWENLTRQEMATVINLFNSDAKFTMQGAVATVPMATNGNVETTTSQVPNYFFALEYPDPYTADTNCRIFEVSKQKSSKLYNGRWSSLSLTLIER